MQAQWFGDVHEDAVRLNAPGQLLPTTSRVNAAESEATQGAAHPDRSVSNQDAEPFADHDGFFYARFQKR